MRLGMAMTSRVGVNSVPDMAANNGAGSEYHIIFNQPSERKSDSNYIRTTKYTFLTFLPLNLYSQFRRAYNIYFLAAAIIAVSMPAASPISPSTTVTPLIVVVLVTMIKDIFEDFLRYQADKAANNQPCVRVHPDGRREPIQSKDVKKGYILEVSRDQVFPADMVLLASTIMPEGRCFVETSQLDGESNMKRRNACYNGDLAPTYDGLFNLLCGSEGAIACDPPNPHLYRFEGHISLRTDGLTAPAISQTASLRPENILLRGAMLKNTDKVLGAVVYVGNNTKIMKNMVKTSLKFSTLEGRLNKLVVAIFIFNVIVLLLSSLFSGSWQSNHRNAWYISWQDMSGIEVAIYHMATYFVLWTYLIPISLFVSIEFVRLSQMFFMKWDAKMTACIDGEYVPMNPSSSNLNEDLGKIDHIFSDKTGTVTKNIMRLVSWVAGDKVFSEEALNLKEGALIQTLRLGPSNEHPLARSLLELTAVCNTVTPEMKNGKLVYDGDSPDEIALMESLRLNGVTLTTRTDNSITLTGDMYEGGSETWTIHSILTFSSARKRMSVVASRKGSDELTLFCKGADSIVIDLLEKKGGKETDQLQKRIDEFARRGYRTLVFAKRTVSRAEFDDYMDRFQAADAAIGQREAKTAEVFASLEKNLELVGCSAVEDKLQDNVPETIAYFLRAGIQFWLLTGDKMETAISVGVSCRVLNAADQVVLIAHAPTLEECRKRFEEAKAELSPSKGLIIDGVSLVHALSNELFPYLLEYAAVSKSVICCRMSPQQKAHVVQGVRHHQKKVTLAIGDGANDVGMILKADVGVGIIGREGTQAARASDYAIGEFQLLQRLVSVIGRYSHLRLAELINYSFYKNIAFIIVVFWFGFYSAWSGKSIYQDSLMAAFNILFTSLPPIMVGLFERDIDDDLIEKNPELCQEVRHGVYFNVRNTTKWTVLAFSHSIIAYFFGTGALGLGGDSAVDLPTMSLFFSTLLIIVVTARMALSIRSWTWPIYGSIILSIGGYLGFMEIVPAVGFSYAGSDGEMFGRGEYYATFFLVFCITFMSDYLITYIQRTYYPFDWQLIQEASRRGDKREDTPLIRK